MERVTHKLKYLWPAAVLVLGMGYLLNPYIDGASEVFCPRIASFLWTVLVLWRISVPVAFVMNCAYLVFAFSHKWSSAQKTIIAISLVILPATWLFSNASDTTWTEKRVSAFSFGGQMRVAWAGGANKVREDALRFLEYSQDTTPPKAKWPTSIRKLDAAFVAVYNSEGIVEVVIPRMNVWANEFGFLIQDVGAQAPEIVDETKGRTIRELAEGIYLYEKW